MKRLKKLLISSIILLVIGFLGLSITLTVGSFDPGYNSFGHASSSTFGHKYFNNAKGRKSLATESNVLSFESVKKLAENYINNFDGKLKITEIMEFTQNYYIEIVEEDTGIGAMELLVDKATGRISPEYGPNMMWNLKYGMHAMMDSSDKITDMAIDEEKALDLAKSYLSNAKINEYAGDEAEKFYGYYTIHTTDKDGNITGMLSVNGFNGEAWYHNWHGIFIKMEEYS